MTNAKTCQHRPPRLPPTSFEGLVFAFYPPARSSLSSCLDRLYLFIVPWLYALVFTCQPCLCNRFLQRRVLQSPFPQKDEPGLKVIYYILPCFLALNRSPLLHWLWPALWSVQMGRFATQLLGWRTRQKYQPATTKTEYPLLFNWVQKNLTRNFYSFNHFGAKGSPASWDQTPCCRLLKHNAWPPDKEWWSTNDWDRIPKSVILILNP